MSMKQPMKPLQARRAAGRTAGGCALFFCALSTHAGALNAAPASQKAPLKNVAATGVKTQSAKAQSATAAQSALLAPLEGDRRILHVLNRLGFGPRPGDVERVREIGVARWIEAQLEPQNLDDSVVENKLASLSALNYSLAQLMLVYESDQLFRREQRLKKLERNGDAMPQGGAKGNLASANVLNADALNANVVADNARPQQLRPQQKRILEDARRAGWERGVSVEAVGQLATAKLLRATESNRQLQEVLVDFWSNHFNLDVRKGPVRTLRLADDRDVIRPHVWGNFRQLLGASAKSPAMLWYLDNVRSTVEQAMPQGARMRNGQAQRGQNGMARGNNRNNNRNNRRFNRNGQNTTPTSPDMSTQAAVDSMDTNAMDTNAMDTNAMDANATMMADGDAAMQNDGAMQGDATQGGAAQKVKKRMRGGINENYGRELMELHTLGVDGGYTQKDVQEVARCFSGWSIDRGNGSFQFRARAHDNGEKLVLGRVIPAGGGIRDGEIVLDMLANHASTARHIARELCTRLVSDEPSPALVERASQVFLETKGDLKSVVRSIVTSREFNSQAAFRAKIKSPFEFAVSAVRAVGGTLQVGDPTRPRGRLLLIARGTPSTNANGGGGYGGKQIKTLAREISDMGQTLFAYQAPTGWPEDSRRWVSSGALIARLNFALHLTGGEVVDAPVQLPALLKGLSGDDHEAVLNRLIGRLLGGEISASTRATLVKQMAAPSTSSPTLLDQSSKEPAPSPQKAQAAQTPPDAARLTALLLGSPEFQRR